MTRRRHPAPVTPLAFIVPGRNGAQRFLSRDEIAANKELAARFRRENPEFFAALVEDQPARGLLRRAWAYMIKRFHNREGRQLLSDLENHFAGEPRP